MTALAVVLGFVVGVPVVLTVVGAAHRAAAWVGVALVAATSLNRPLSHVVPEAIAPVVVHADDALLGLLVVVLAVSPRRVRAQIPGLVWVGFAAFAAAGVASALVSAVAPAPALLGTWLAVKLPLTLWVMTRLDWTARARRALVLLVAGVVVVSTAVAAVELVAPEAVRSVFGAPRASASRLGLPPLKGIFEHPVQSATFMLFAVAILSSVDQARRLRALAVVASVGSLMTLRAKAAVNLALVWGVRVARSRRRDLRALAPLLAVVVIVAGVALTWDLVASRVSVFLEGETVARRSLLDTAVDIAAAGFPWGSGFGTFGSEASVRYYSPLYFTHGLSEQYGFRVDNPIFATDASWAAVLAETGWLGALGMALALLALAVAVLRRAAGGPRGDWATAASMFVTVCIVDSLASPRLFDGFAAAGLGALVAVALGIPPRADHAPAEQHAALESFVDGARASESEPIRRSVRVYRRGRSQRDAGESQYP